YFDPQIISIIAETTPGLFVDGGFSPHNNPALYLFLVAALPQLKLSWPLGSNNLTIISIGTGSFQPRMGLADMPWIGTFGLAVHALTAQISDSQQLVLALM